LQVTSVEAEEYDIGTTSVRLVRVGSIIQIFFSGKLEAKFFYDQAATIFKDAKTNSKVANMSLSEQKKRELRSLADATGEALDALIEYNDSRREIKPAVRNSGKK